MITIYLVRCVISKKVYVGQTVKTLHNRWREHVYRAVHFSEAPLHCAIRKYGDRAFRITAIGTANSSRHADEMETALIRSYRSTQQTYGYNLKPGGSSSRGYKCIALSKSKIGHEVSRHTREKIASSLKGRKLSKAHRRSLSRSQKIRFHKRGACGRHSAAMRRPEVVAIMSKAHLGKRPSLETRLKLSRIRRGRKLSRTWRLKISLAITKWHALQRNSQSEGKAP